MEAEASNNNDVKKPVEAKNSFKNYRLQGNKLDIIVYPNAILKKKALSVKVFDQSLESLVFNMLYTMYNHFGIGLAAPQVGKIFRLFVLDVNYRHERQEDPVHEKKKEIQVAFDHLNPKVFINPKIVKKQEEVFSEEGCLSFPGIYEKVKRAKEITVEYYNLSGEKKTLQADGLLSICIQHEYDHLDGVVFLERMGRLKYQFFMKKYLKDKKRNE